MHYGRTGRLAGALGLATLALASGCIVLTPGSETTSGERGEDGAGGRAEPPPQPPAPWSPDLELTFSQLDFEYDEGTVVDSSWGAVDINYIANPDSPVLFFNLEVDGEWKIRNVPVRGGGDAATIALTFSFDLGVYPETRVDGLSYATTLTVAPLVGGPGEDSEKKEAEVADKSVVIRSGLLEDFGYYGGVPIDDPVWFIWSDWEDFAFHPWESIVNQECGDSECFACAVSNSHKMLKKLHPEKMKGLTDDPNSSTDDTDVATLKPAGGWIDSMFSKGAPAGPTTDSPGACWNLKKKWTDERAKYPIDTEIMDDPDGFDRVLEAVRAGKDVELIIIGHAVMVTGVVKTTDGRFILEVAHDNEQGKKGGTIVELVEYNPADRKFHGSDYFDGDDFGASGSGHPLFMIESVQ